MEEEGIRFALAKNVFYNPAMRLCRSMSSLAVGAIGEDLEVVDAFCASGIRGLRYAEENINVKKLTSLDIDKKAVSLAKRNAASIRIPRSRFSSVCANISRAAFDLDADLLEMDPFGTPSPYLVDAFRFFNTKKSAYLSATATDVAVLCGGKEAPCMKNYHSKPMNNEFTHETGLRILLKKIAETAAEFNMGVSPLVSFSDRHYLKTVVRCTRGAERAAGCMKSIGHVWHCRSCGFRSSGRFPERCGNCGKETEYAGPLWLGELHERRTIQTMRYLNDQRSYSDKKEIGRMLGLMEGEVGMPPYYYNVHDLCKLQGARSVPTMEAVLSALSAAGFRARRTHFSPLCIKTDAPYPRILEALGWRG